VLRHIHTPFFLPKVWLDRTVLSWRDPAGHEQGTHTHRKQNLEQDQIKRKTYIPHSQRPSCLRLKAHAAKVINFTARSQSTANCSLLATLLAHSSYFKGLSLSPRLSSPMIVDRAKPGRILPRLPRLPAQPPMKAVDRLDAPAAVSAHAMPDSHPNNPVISAALLVVSAALRCGCCAFIHFATTSC
jgi:hypothetical protein